MPLKRFRRGKTWYVRGTVAGSYCYETTGTADPKKAEAYRAKREAELWERRVYGDRAVVTFNEAAVSYLQARQPSDAEKLYIRRLTDHFGTTKLAKIDQAALDRAYAEILKPDAAPATKARGVLSPLCAILNHAARRGWCGKPAFEHPQLPTGKTRWLSPLEYLQLEEAASEHIRPLLRFIACTGARVAEAIELEWTAVDLPESKAVFWITKNTRPRAAALPPAAVVSLAKMETKEGRVFRRPDGEPYADRKRETGGQIRKSFETACIRAGFVDVVLDDRGEPVLDEKEIPVVTPNLTPHDLRHSWATWFYCLTRDPFLLRDEGGWQTVRMVERYAHLMRSDLAADVAAVWGASHPRIGALPVRAESVQAGRRA